MSLPALRVAVVDDDEAVLHSSQFLLELEGHTVEPFRSGGDFLNAVDGNSFDCLILDHHMPNLTGLEVARRLRTRGERLPILLMSGAMTADIRSRATEIGMVEIAEKPLAIELLVRFVASARS